MKHYTMTMFAVLLVIYNTEADSTPPGPDSAPTSVVTTPPGSDSAPTKVITASTDSVNEYTECKDAEGFDCILYNPTVICNTSGIYYPWAKARCPLYCGFCHRPTLTILCKDELPNCGDYQGDMCSNPFYRIFRERKCRKHCGICKDFDSIPNTDSLYG